MAPEQVAKSAPDGYTLLLNSSAIVLNPLLNPAKPYDPFKSFIPIAKIGNSPSALVVHPSVPASTVKELIALAKKEPGKLVAAASGGGSRIHLSTELFKSMAGIDFKIVQFKGGGPAVIDLLETSPNSSCSIQQSLPHIQSGKIRALGYAAASRSKLLPNLPTISEAGLPGYRSLIWWGMFAGRHPQGDRRQALPEIGTIMKTEEMQKTFVTQGAEQDLMDTAAFTKFMESESAKWGKVIKEGNIKLE